MAGLDFALGRYRETNEKGSSGAIKFLFTEFITTTILPFRNLLALVVIGMFAFALGYAIVSTGNQPNGLRDSLQAVVSTL
jgi:hypothetical protein